MSLVADGQMRHRDSLGNDITVSAGGTCWTHAGSGLIHEETFVSDDVWVASTNSVVGLGQSYAARLND